MSCIKKTIVILTERFSFKSSITSLSCAGARRFTFWISYFRWFSCLQQHQWCSFSQLRLEKRWVWVFLSCWPTPCICLSSQTTCHTRHVTSATYKFFSQQFWQLRQWRSCWLFWFYTFTINLQVFPWEREPRPWFGASEILTHQTGVKSRPLRYL